VCFGQYKRPNSISKLVSSSGDCPALSGAADAQYSEEFNPSCLDLEEIYINTSSELAVVTQF